MKNKSLVGRFGAVLGTLLIVTALAGCASASGSGGGPGGPGGGGSGPSSGSSSGSHSAQDITGHWQLVSGTDAKGAISPGSTAVTFTIDGTSSGGRGPCNSFGATTQGSTTGPIKIAVGIHTNMACIDPELNATEARYFAALGKVTTAALDNGTLNLRGNGDSLSFTRATQ